jgi:hypothetical protein
MSPIHQVVIISSITIMLTLIWTYMRRHHRRNSNHLVLSSMTTLDNSCRTIPVSRLLSRTWWLDSALSSEYPSDEFLRNFRMRRSSFDALVELLELDDNIAINGLGLSAAHQLAVALYRIGSGVSCRTAGTVLGVADSTVGVCCRR